MAPVGPVDPANPAGPANPVGPVGQLFVSATTAISYQRRSIAKAGFDHAVRELDGDIEMAGIGEGL